MREWLRIGLAVLVVIALAGFATLAWTSRDRVFHGKPESVWIHKLGDHSRYDDEVNIQNWRDFGAEGVPILVKALRKGSEPWDKFYFKLRLKLPAFLNGRLPDPADFSEGRSYAATILGLMGNDAKMAVPELVRALKDQNPVVRAKSAFALTSLLPGMGKEKDAFLPSIIEAAQDKEWGVKNNVLAVLMFSYPDRPDLVAPAAVRALGDSDPRIRLVGIAMLWNLYNHGATNARAPELVQLLDDGNVHVREHAASTLRSMDWTRGNEDKIGVPELVRALKDPQPNVRSQSVGALGRLMAGKGKEKNDVLPSLIEAAQDKNQGVRQNVLIALADFPDRADLVMPVAVKALGDSDPRCRILSIYLLIDLNAHGATNARVPELVKLLQDRDERIQAAAKNALWWIDHPEVARAGVK